MGRMEPLSDLYHDNIIMPSAPRVLFRLLFRLPVKERGLSADAEGQGKHQRSLFSEQAEAFAARPTENITRLSTRASAAAAAAEPMAMPISMASHAHRPSFSVQSAQLSK